VPLLLPLSEPLLDDFEPSAEPSELEPELPVDPEPPSTAGSPVISAVLPFAHAMSA
jgi:hypothetical protein